MLPFHWFMDSLGKVLSGFITGVFIFNHTKKIKFSIKSWEGLIHIQCINKEKYFFFDQFY